MKKNLVLESNYINKNTHREQYLLQEHIQIHTSTLPVGCGGEMGMATGIEGINKQT